MDIRPRDLQRVWETLSAGLPGEARVFVFGSRARRTAKPASDLDLAVDAGRPLTRGERARLEDGFEASDLPYKVDIVALWAAIESFRMIIDRAKVSLPKP